MVRNNNRIVSEVLTWQLKQFVSKRILSEMMKFICVWTEIKIRQRTSWTLAFLCLWPISCNNYGMRVCVSNKWEYQTQTCTYRNLDFQSTAQITRDSSTHRDAPRGTGVPGPGSSRQTQRCCARVHLQQLYVRNSLLERFMKKIHSPVQYQIESSASISRTWPPLSNWSSHDWQRRRWWMRSCTMRHTDIKEAT